MARLIALSVTRPVAAGRPSFRAGGRFAGWVRSVYAKPQWVVGAIVLVSAALAATFSLQIVSFEPDELGYTHLAIGIAHSLTPITLSYGGAQKLNQLYPLLIAPLWGTFGNVTAFQLTHAWNALLLASAAIPTYLLAQEVLRVRWASIPRGGAGGDRPVADAVDRRVDRGRGVSGVRLGTARDAALAGRAEPPARRDRAGGDPDRGVRAVAVDPARAGVRDRDARPRTGLPGHCARARAASRGAARGGDANRAPARRADRRRGSRSADRRTSAAQRQARQRRRLLRRRVHRRDDQRRDVRPGAQLPDVHRARPVCRPGGAGVWIRVRDAAGAGVASRARVCVDGARHRVRDHDPGSRDQRALQRVDAPGALQLLHRAAV